MKKIALVMMAAFLLLSGCTKAGVDDSGKVSILDKTLSDIKEAYGDDYGPDGIISKEVLEEVYSLTMDNVSYYVAEAATISMSSDVFIGMVANPGKIEELTKEVEAYREYLINDSFQYPMNMPKIQASTIVVKDNVIFFFVLGKLHEDMDASEEEQLAFAKEQAKIAVDVINKNFN